MKAYSTFAGAKRAADGKPIVRLLDDPHEIWIVIERLDTDIMIFTAEGRKYDRAGTAANCFDLAAREETLGS